MSLHIRLRIIGSLLLTAISAPLFPLQAADLVHRYSFTSDANDSVGTANGALLGGATVSGGAVVLNGSSAYVDLPNGLVSTLTNATFEVWLTDNSSGTWARMFDFGNNTAGEGASGTGTSYLFLCPQSGNGNLRGAITIGGGEQQVNSAARLPAGSLKHVCWTIDAATQTSRLYVDGSLVAENTGMPLNPASLGYTLNNWIGRSQFSADPYLNASITEFRIYDGPLTAAEVQNNYTNGPEVSLFDGPAAITTQPQNQTVAELSPVTFQVSYRAAPPAGLQWQRNGVNIPGATSSTYTLASAALTNNGAVFSLVLTNSYLGTNYTATSSNAVLTVIADTNPPVLVRAAGLFPGEVLVTFSESVREDTATNKANYVITSAGGSLAVTGARFGNTVSNIILTTAAQSLGTNYTLTINGVCDLAVAANLIATNSQASFIATTFTTTDIGNPASVGTFTAVSSNAFNLTASGSGISGTNDQFTFCAQSYTNNFDVQVRVAVLSLAGTWTRAALMARDGLATNALFAASVATPGPAGCHFESRSMVGGSAAMTGAFPVNFPDTWLRLRRVGNVFDGFASLDGLSWEYLGSSTIAMSNVVQLGFALTAASTNTSATAQFRDFANAGGTITTNAALPFEPLGPCSRRTALVISEIMYNPPASWPGGDDLEFVELWNSGLITEDLTGHKLAGDISYSFPNGTTIAPGQFLVVAKNPSAAQSFYGVTCLGPYANKLSNSGGTLQMLNELGGILLEISFDNKAPWPVAADGTGHSLVLSRPSYGENDPRAWSASDVMGGSPGAYEHYGREPARGVVVNEILAHTDLPQVDYVELFNTRTQAVDLSGAWLSDTAGTNKYQIVGGTTIPARGFLAFTETQLGFGLNAEGEKVILVNSNLTRVLDAVKFDGQENGVSLGRYPDGAPGFQRLSTVTLGTSNTPPRLSPVVINEIMYAPISGDDNDEYVELYNRSTNTINLGGWQLQDGIGYTFPSNTVITAGGYVVVGKSVTNLLAKYSQLNATNTCGGFSGKLSNSGERLALAMPDDIVNDGVTNIFYIVVNGVTYVNGGRWGKWSAGGGSSLELIDPNSDTRLAANWADSDESSKAAWTTIDVTNIMENGHSAGQGDANRLEFYLQDSGEVLVDNLAFLSNGGGSLVSNGNFESGTSGWTFEGVLRNSYVQSGGGVGGSQALHVVSVGRGDTGPNKVVSTLTSAAATGSPNTGTIRASVRWLKGSPWIMLRPRGHWMEAVQKLNVPANCGTPGLPNSRYVTNAGPAIVDVAHSPVLPAANQAVVVTARAIDADGAGAVTLNYRVDPATSYTSVTMLDNGTGGDAVAGDGIYSATIPGQGSGALVTFYISATDTLAAASRFPAEAPTRECLVRWGEPAYAGSLGTYRLWVTSSNLTFWANREVNANDTLDATFVYNNCRVIYNADTMYSGSPFHAPNDNGPLGSFACDYEVNFQPDDKFLGSEPFVLTAFDVSSGNFFLSEQTGQADLTGEWIARKLGQQYNYRRHIHAVVNGQHRGTIYDDAQQPNSEMRAEYHANDANGQIRKIEDWFEFADDAQTFSYVTATLTRYNQSTGDIDAKRYRWNWMPRATDNPNDWADLTSLIAAVNATNTTSPAYLKQVRTWMDVPNFLRPIITHHVCGDWDSYGYERGKNMFAYKPDNQGWRLMLWDIELGLGCSSSKPATDSIYDILDPTLLTLITSTPAIHREYLRGFQEAVDTALLPGVANTILDERYANLQQNNVGVNSPATIENFLTARRAYLLSILPNVTFAVSNASYQVITGSNTIIITGTGPLNVENILVNSNAYVVTWTSLTNWSVTVPLAGGTNVLNIAATDRNGSIITNATGSVTANYTDSTVAPEGFVVFNEIQYRPATNGGEYVELFNAHTNYTFDLSGWSINGLGYTFPPGSTIAPRSYLVLAADSVIFSRTYGTYAFDQFSGSLDTDGETLTLFRPGTGTNQIVVNRVRYEAAAPWPVITNGASLQLIDATQDNRRVANWTLGSTNTVSPVQPPSPLALMAYSYGWRYTQTNNLDGINWIATNYNDSAWPTGPGLLAFENNSSITPFINTVLNDPRIPTNGMAAGHGYYFRTSLVLSNNPAGYQFTVGARVDDGAVFYVNGVEVQRVRMAAAVTITNSSLTTGQPPSSDAIADDTFSIPATAFGLGTNYLAVEVHQSATTSSDIVFGMSLTAVYTNTLSVASSALYTPGAINSVAANLPVFPPVWLNELQADNVTGPLDNNSQHDPWAEIFNGATTNFSLAGYYLTDTYTNLTKWAFPTNAAVSSNGFTLVWCDNQTNQNATNSIHAAFTLASGGGRLALSRVVNGTNQIVDYLNYSGLPANWSYGDVPDGQPFYRGKMSYVTPGTNNNGASAPITIFINEWMADNSHTLANPYGSAPDDWFELYNPGTNSVDLGGYYLTGTLTNKTKFHIPTGARYVVPANGFLVVWADNNNSQNSTNRPELHVNFALKKSGEAIGIFAADGTTIDAVTFGAQSTDVSEGRFPDGAANRFFMPTPTPGAANLVPNTAPTLAPITNRVVTLGQTLSFIVSATDTDQPPQTLTFTLTNAPVGAQIGATSGAFTWTPTTAPATNSFTVVVADNGTPNLGATRSFTVVTAPIPVPMPGSQALNGNQFTFSWNTVAGQQFQVEIKDDLSDANWTPIGGILTGTGDPQVFTNVLDESTRRFFRLRVLP